MAWPALIAVGMSLLSTGAGALGGILGGNREKDLAEYQARIQEADAKRAEYQADFAMYNAKVIREMTDIQAGRIQEEAKEVIASQRVSAAGRGVQGSVSALELELDTVQRAAKDYALVVYAGDVEATNKYYDATMAQYQAKLNRVQADFTRQSGDASAAAGWLRAGGTLLTGGSSALSMGSSMGLFGKGD